jgi:hypothetical protein
MSYVFGNNSEDQRQSFDMQALTKTFKSPMQIAQLNVGRNGAYADGYAFMDNLANVAAQSGLRKSDEDTRPSSFDRDRTVTASPSSDRHSPQPGAFLLTGGANGVHTTESNTHNNDLRSSLAKDASTTYEKLKDPHTINGQLSISVTISHDSPVSVDDKDDITLLRLRKEASSQASPPADTLPDTKVASTKQASPTKKSPKQTRRATAQRIVVPDPSTQATPDGRNQKRRRTKDSDNEGEVTPSPKKAKTIPAKATRSPSKNATASLASYTSPDDMPSSDNESQESSEDDGDEGSDYDTAYSSRTQSYSPTKSHRNTGKDRNPPFTNEEYDAVFDAVYARRTWENANPGAAQLRDQPFWECILKNVHAKRQCMGRKTWGSLKNFWNRVGRERSQFEERLNGSKNGKLTASIQKPKGGYKRKR